MKGIRSVPASSLPWRSGPSYGLTATEEVNVVESIQERLEHLENRQRIIEQRLRIWRGVAVLVGVGALLLLPMGVGKATTPTTPAPAPPPLTLEQRASNL